MSLHAGKAAAALKPILPVFLLAVGVTIACAVLNVRDENADKPVCVILGVTAWYGIIHGVALLAFCKYICPAGTPEGAIFPLYNPGNTGDFSMLNIRFTRKFVIMPVIGLACVFCYRSFCRFLCPDFTIICLGGSEFYLADCCGKPVLIAVYISLNFPALGAEDVCAVHVRFRCTHCL